MRALAILLIAAMLCTNTIGAQDGPTNLEKYWMYKERQKNYRLVGDCQGCSLPVGARSSSDLVEWRDQTGEQGYYIATLAMEYKMRLDHGLPVADVDRELFYAIESLNRLDIAAEYWWEYYYNGNTTSPTPALNGFLIRDDVPANFFSTLANGNLAENQFNHSMFPPPPGFGAFTVSSGFTRGPLVAPCQGHTPGPEEMSQDHFIAILAGLAIVVKVLPPTASFGNQNFMDGQSYFAQEAKNIVFRIVEHAQAENWLYKNPVTGHPVQGIEWDECDPSDNDLGGGSLRFLSHGFAMGASLILNDFEPIGSLAYYISHYSSDSYVATSDVLFQTSWRFDPPLLTKNEDYKILMLGAIANIWGNNTQQILGERFDAEYQNGDEVHVPQAVLINSLLHGNTMAVPNSVWECMLNSAPCDDFTMSNENFEWSHGHGRFLYGPNVQHYLYNDQLSGLPYLYFFNIYSLCNPAYLGSTYSVLPFTQLMNSNLTLTNQNIYYETAEINYSASNQIRTQNVFRVTNDNNPAQAYAAPLDAASVTFAAGQSIVLAPGFEVIAGSNFHGYINPNLQSISCEGQNHSATCTNCKVGGTEENPDNIANGDHGVIIIPTENNECLVAYEHHLFKVDLSSAQGTTMFGIGETDDCSNFPCSDPMCAGDRRYSVLGFHNFNDGSNIVDVVYTGTETYVALAPISGAQGRVIKISGTGGVGIDIIGATENAGGDLQAVGNSYLLGQQNFEYEINQLKHFNKRLFIIMENRLVKIGPATLLQAFGSNMFDVTTNANFDFVWGWNSLGDSGDEKFTHMEITECGYFNGYLFVCGKDGILDKGKILKIDGMGETGNNMFHVDHTPSGNGDAFDPIAGHQNYAGDQYFDNQNCFATQMTEANGELLLSFRNGSLLKLQGVGGTGHNMFNAEYSGNGFDVANFAYPVFLIGSQQFDHGVWSTDIDFVAGVTYISCYDGKILKVTGSGGTGYNMFNVDANSGYGFTTTNSNANVYMLGCADFRMTVTELTAINNHLLVSLHPGVMINLIGSGTGNNMFGLAYQDENSYKSQCGYFYFEGSEDFTDLCLEHGNRAANFDSNSEINNQNSLHVFPNPSEGVVNITLHLLLPEQFELDVYNSLGELVFSETQEGSEEIQKIDLSENGSGIYIIIVRQGPLIMHDKILVK